MAHSEAARRLGEDVPRNDGPVKKTAKLHLDGKDYELPVMVGTEGEVGIDIQSLRSQTGAITYDPGFGSTGACRSTPGRIG